AYLLPQRLDRNVYVGTTVWFFFASNYAKIVPYALLGQLDLTNLATAFVLLPLVPIGVKLGVVIQGKLDEKVFYQISYWALLGIGVKLLYDGAFPLLR
ncbi:MAG: sulfite exporter TauE/SafE family protein, partial [Betaproteobacteria bacterium]|nr:sulfite exporter TauE/SafE family protein [Betaproteobacteria bacterium]